MRDLAFGVGMLGVAGAVYAMAAAIPQSDLADAVGPAGLPRLYAIGLAILSLLLVARVLAERRAAPAPETIASATGAGTGREAHRPSWRPFATLLIGVVYIGVVPWLGYPLSLAALIATTVVAQGGTISRQVVVIAAAGAAFLWLLFVWLLDIQHPAGVWSSLF